MALLACSSLAYRPFDGTDASVADLDELETEFQPAGALWEGSQTTLIAPDLVFNFGFKENWEATLEGRLETPLSPAEPSSLLGWLRSRQPHMAFGNKTNAETLGAQAIRVGTQKGRMR